MLQNDVNTYKRFLNAFNTVATNEENTPERNEFVEITAKEEPIDLSYDHQMPSCSAITELGGQNQGGSFLRVGIL